ncbi:WD40 repeat-like protein [Leucogyrophana mollusca]|uniref:WD40 repeat-like protein n=1 Tax=Leucogyrophana mollusca TaxID=85980 RepID=A0ACB8B165_9AGAM|nr:WD40 repeat-like protein [Leucogyrophana mollusca]
MSSPAGSGSSAEQSHVPTKVFKGHTSFVTSVAYFPDGRRIASGSRDKTIRIWNVESDQHEGECLEHDSSVEAIAIAPDGGKIAGRVVGGLIEWEVVRWKRVRAVKIDGESEQSAYTAIVAYSPDGRWIVTASSENTSIQLWDVDIGSPVRELQQHVDTVMSLSFSPDGARIATGLHDGSFRVLDIASGGAVVGPIHGHQAAVTSLVYSPDGRLLTTVSWDRTVRTWDAETGWEVGRPMLPPSLILCIAISANRKRIASTSSDRVVRLWNLETRLQVGDLFASRPSVWIYSVAFSPNGRIVISGGTHDVFMWDTAAIFDSAASPPATSNRESSNQTPSKAHRDTSSLSSSILDLPAAVQPQPEQAKKVERAPSIDDRDSFQSHHACYINIIYASIVSLFYSAPLLNLPTLSKNPKPNLKI